MEKVTGAASPPSPRLILVLEFSMVCPVPDAATVKQLPTLPGISA